MTTETATPNQADASTAFLRAARAGQIDRIISLLEQGVDINVSNANGLNAIHLASKDGHVEVVRELLDRGAAIDAATKKGNTALHIASLAGQEPVVKLLVQNGAQVNIQSQNGFTPLYMAAQENHDGVVRFLLSNGANQSLATEDGFTPLAVAMQQGHEKVVAVLLEADTRGRVRLPALHIAAKKDDVKAANLLLENEHNPDVTSKSGFTPLHIAAHYGNESVARLLLAKGADVNSPAKHNICPLHVAAKWGKDNMVTLLGDNGGNVEARTRDGLTPLHCAARSGHERVVEALLDRGAPITSKSKNGLAPLHMAAQGDHAEAAKMLLSRRAPVDDVTVDYLTALHVAAHCGHAKVAKLLLDKNADANARALNGFTPLHIACKKNRIKVVELLLKYGASIQATTESGLTPLHVAAFMGCMNIVIYLLQHEANPDVPTVRGETPLHLAARANQTDIIRILLRNGAAVEAKARERQTPLHIASRLGNVDIAVLLLQHGADVRAMTADHYNALHIAAKQHNHDVAAALIEHGAPLTATTKKGFTPLHLAAKYGNLKVANLLLAHGAAPDQAGKNGVTPLHVAAQYDQQAVASTLLEKGADAKAVAKNGHTPLHIAARKNQMETAATLLEHGAITNAESKAGFTPLHLAAQQGHAEMCSLLLEHGADVNQQAKNGLSALHLAAQEDRVPVAELLAKNGGEVDICTKGGYTPLHVASHFGQTNMVRFLLDNEASVKAETTHGYTALHHAAQQGHINIVNVLLDHKADANSTTTNGQTPLDIASKLGYVTIMETLKNVSEPSMAPATQDKYKVVAPETMYETFMSDSEEEGGEDTALNDQPYRYLTADDMKSLGDDSLPIDVTRDERAESVLGHKNIMEISQTSANGVAYPQQDVVVKSISRYSTTQAPEGYCYNVDPTVPKSNSRRYLIITILVHAYWIRNNRKKLTWKNFLVSFLVDARGGAMKGCRGGGVRVIVPPSSAQQPTRITCRYLKPSRINHMPPLMEGEALAARVLEMGPVSAKFIGPVILEVPHYASLRGKEREIVILRSDNGTSWREHNTDATEDIVQDILHETLEIEENNEEAPGSQNPRVTRILTHDFPQYFAVISRIRQEVHAIGPEGGMVSSSVVPQVQAVFPQGALTKKIKVGLQAQIIDSELTAKLLGRGVAVSPVVTVEPRRRKFHKAITLSMPAPRPHTQGMTNQYSTSSAPTLRLLCSISGGTNRAHWEDVTDNTPLTFVNDCVSFTTTVSARYWLIDCRHVEDATKMATELYREAIHVPFMARFVVYAKKAEDQQALLRMFCVTDDREDKTLEKIERFAQVAKSRDVEVHEGKPSYLEFAGNLVPIAKSGEQHAVPFRAFRENRLAFQVMVKSNHSEPIARCQFMREQKVPKGEPSPAPICVLNIVIPEEVTEVQVERTTTPIIATRNEDQEILWKQRLNDPRLEDICNLLGKDWVALAYELGVSVATVNQIQAKRISAAEQAQLMLKLWKTQSGTKALDNSLELALCRIGRDDIIAIQSEVSNVRRIQRNIYQERQASEEIEAYKAEEDNKLKEKMYEDNKMAEIMRKESELDQDEAKYSPEEKSVHEKSEIERTSSPSDISEEDEDIKRSVAERKEQITRKLSSSKIPASKQKKEIREEIIEIKTQIKPDIKKFQDIEQQQVKESKLERTRSKTSPESIEEEKGIHIQKEQVEVTKAIEKPAEQFRKFDPSSPSKPTPKHLQRHIRNDSMRFPSGDFSSVTVTPRKSITAESTEVNVTEKKTETTFTKKDISEKESFTSQVKEKLDDGDKSPELVEDDKDVAEPTLKDLISSFETKIPKEPSIELPKTTIKLTKEALKKHTMEQEHGIEYTQEFVREQSKQITEKIAHTHESVKTVKDTIQRFDSKTKQDDKKAPKTHPSAIRTDSTLVQVSSEEDNEFLKKSTDSETETESHQTMVKVESKVTKSDSKETKLKENLEEKVKKDAKGHKLERMLTDELRTKVSEEELRETLEEKEVSTIEKIKKEKIEPQMSIASTKSDISKHTKTDSVGSDLQKSSQESPITSFFAKTDSLADLPTEKDVSFVSQTESKVYSKDSKQRSDSLDEASQFSDLDDQVGSSPAHRPVGDLTQTKIDDKDAKSATTGATESSTKYHIQEFLKYESEYSAEIQAPAIPPRDFEQVSPKESPVISAKARQFIETLPEDDSVQECFFSKRIYSDSLEDSEQSDSRRHSEAESLKSDQSDVKAKDRSSDFDERAEYEETVDSGSGFGDENFEKSIAISSMKMDTTVETRKLDTDSSEKVEEASTGVIFKKMPPKRHSRTESISITKLSDLQLDTEAPKKQEFQVIVTEAEEIDRSDKEESSDKISSESSREIEISDRKSSEGISDKISSEDAVTDKKTSSEEDALRSTEIFLQHEKGLAKIATDSKEFEKVDGKLKGAKDEKVDVVKRQSVTSAESVSELRLDEKRLSDAYSLTESRDYTFEESEDDIIPPAPHVDSKDKVELKQEPEFKMKTVASKVEPSKLSRLIHGDSLDDVEGFPEDHVTEHVHKLPHIAEVGTAPEKDVTSDFLLREREEQLKRETVQKASTTVTHFEKPSDRAQVAFSKETETSYTVQRSGEPTVVTEVKSIIKDTGVTTSVEQIQTTTKSATKFDISKIRTDTLCKINGDDSKGAKNKFTPKDLDLKETAEITKDQVKPVIDDILHKGTIAAAAKSPVKDIDIKKDFVETEKRSYDAKAPQKDERRHSCISPAISLERIAESDVESDEDVLKQVPIPVPESKKITESELKKSDSAMKQMADNIEIIIKQASEDIDLSSDELVVESTEAQERQDMADKVSVDSIIEEAVRTVENYQDTSKEVKEEIEMKKEIVFQETKKSTRPALMKSLSRDSGEIVIMPKKKHPRTFSVQSSPEEIEEQIYTDSESDMDKAKVLEIIEPGSDADGKATTSSFDTRKIRTDSLDDADDLFPEKEAEFGDDGKYGGEQFSESLRIDRAQTQVSEFTTASTSSTKEEVFDDNLSQSFAKKSKFVDSLRQADIVSKSTTESSVTTVVSTLTKSSEEDQKSVLEDGTSADFSRMSGAELVKDSSKTSMDIKDEFRVDEQIAPGTPDLSKKSIDLTKDYSKSSIDSKDTSKDFATNELSKDSTVDLSKDYSKASIESVRDISKSIDEKTFSEDHSSFDVSKTLASDVSEGKEFISEDRSISKGVKISTSSETSVMTESKLLDDKSKSSEKSDKLSPEKTPELKSEVKEDAQESDQVEEVPDMSELNRRCSTLLEDISQGTLIKIDSSHVTHDLISKFSKTPPPSPVDLVSRDKAKTEDGVGDKQTGLHLRGSDSSFLDASRHSPRASSAGDSMMSETEAHQSEILTTSMGQGAAARPKSPTKHLADNMSFVNVDQPTITSGAIELVDRTIEKSIDVIDQIKKEQLAVQMEDLQRSGSSDVFYSQSRIETSTSSSSVHKSVGSELKFQSIDPAAVMSDMVDKFGTTDSGSVVLTHKETETRQVSGQEFFSQTKQVSSSDDDSLVIKTETSHELREQEHETKEKTVVKKDGDQTDISQKKTGRAHEALAKRADIETKTVTKSTDDDNIIKVEREFLEQGLYTGRQSKSEEKMTAIKDETVKKKHEIKISERDLSHEQWGKEYFTDAGELQGIIEDEDKSKISFIDSTLKIIEKDEVVSSTELSEKGKIVSSTVEHHKEESVIESKEHDDLSTSDASHAPSFKSETADRRGSSETSPKSKSKSFKKDNETYEVGFIKEIKISTSPIKSTFSRSGSQETHSESEAAPDLPHDDKTGETPKKDKPSKIPVKVPQQQIQDQLWEVSVQKTDSFESATELKSPKLRTASENKSSDSGDTILELKTVVVDTEAATKTIKSDLSPSTMEISDDISTTSKDIMIKSGESIDTEYMIKSLESHEAEVLQKSMDSTGSAATLHASEFSTEADSAFLTGTDGQKREELKLVKEKSLEDICSSGYDTDLSSAEFQAKLESERVDYDSLISAQPLADLSVLEKTIDEVKQSLEAAQGEIISEQSDGSSKYKQSPSEFQFKMLVSPDRPEVITEEPQLADEQVEKTPATRGEIDEKTRTLDSQMSDTVSQKISSQEETTTSDEDKESTVQVKESSPPNDSGDYSIKSDSGPHSILETESEIILSDRDSSSKGSPEVKLRVQKHMKSKLGVGERRSASEVEGWSSSGGSRYESFEHSESRPLSSDVDVMMTAQSGTADFETALTSHDVSSSLRTSKDYYTAASSLASRDSMKSLDSDSSHIASIDISDASETLVPSATELKEELMESSTYVEQFLHEGEKVIKREASEDELSVDGDEKIALDELGESIGKMKRSHEMRFTSKEKLQDHFIAGIISESMQSIEVDEDSTKDKDGSDTTTISSQFKTDEYLSSSISKLDMPSSQSEPEIEKKEIKEPITKVSVHEQYAVPFAVTKVDKVQREFVDLESEIIPVGSLQYEEIVNSGSIKTVTTRRPHELEETTIIKATVHEVKASPTESKPIEIIEECVKKVVQEVAVTPFPIAKKPASQREFVDVESEIIPVGSQQYEEILKSKSDSSVPKTKVEKSTIKTEDSQLDSKQSSTSSLKTQEILSSTQTPLSGPSQSSLSTDNGREYVLDDMYDISETPELKSELLTEGTSSRSEAAITSEDRTIRYTEAEQSDRESPTSDEFELVDKPSEMDDFVVIEEVAREAQETDTEGKCLQIKSQKMIKKHDTEVEEMLSKASKKQESSSTTSGSYSDEELLQGEVEQKRVQDQELAEIEAGKKWVQMQFEGDPRYDYERVPLEDIKEEEMTDFDASRIGSLSSQKESVGSLGSFRNSYGSLSESEMASRLRFRIKGENDDVSISSLQEFENLEKALMEQYQQHSSSSQDSLNGSLPRRYVLSKSQGDDMSVSSLNEFEGLESACLEALKAEILAKQKEALLQADPKDVSGSFLEQEKRSYSGSSESSPPQKGSSPSQKSGSPSQKSGSPSQKSGSPSQKVGSYGSPSQKILTDSAAIRKLIDQQMALEERLREQSVPIVPRVITVQKFDDRGAYFVPEPVPESTSTQTEVSEDCRKSSAFVCAAPKPKDGSAESIPGDCEEMMRLLDQEEKQKSQSTVTRTITKDGVTEIVRTTTIMQQKFVDGKKVSEVLTSSDGVDIPGTRSIEYEADGAMSFGSEMSSSVASQQSDMDSLMTVVEQHNVDGGSVTVTKQTIITSSSKPEDLEFSRADSVIRELSPSSGRSLAHSFMSVSGKHFTDPASGSWSGQDEELSSSGSLSRGARADLMLGSTDSLEATSSNATRATYNYEVDTPMTGSLTSGGSNTMVSSLDTMDPVTAVQMEGQEPGSNSEQYSQDYEVQEPDSDTERLELDGRQPRAKERTIMFDSTDTLSAVSGDGSVKEAAVETAAPTFYIGDTPIVRGDRNEDEEEDAQPQLSGSCPASLPPGAQSSPPIPAQRRSLTMIAKSPPSSLDGTPKKQR